MDSPSADESGIARALDAIDGDEGDRSFDIENGRPLDLQHLHRPRHESALSFGITVDGGGRHATRRARAMASGPRRPASCRRQHPDAGWLRRCDCGRAGVDLANAWAQAQWRIDPRPWYRGFGCGCRIGRRCSIPATSTTGCSRPSCCTVATTRGVRCSDHLGGAARPGNFCATPTASSCRRGHAPILDADPATPAPADYGPRGSSYRLR